MKAPTAMKRALAAEGRTVRVTNASPTFRRSCDATGLTDMFRRLQDSEPLISELVG